MKTPRPPRARIGARSQRHIKHARHFHGLTPTAIYSSLPRDVRW